MTGGDIVTNRHYLAKILQSEAQKAGVTVIVKPVLAGAAAELEAVSEGKIDLALVQGGLETTRIRTVDARRDGPRRGGAPPRQAVRQGNVTICAGGRSTSGPKDAGVREHRARADALRGGTRSRTPTASRRTTLTRRLLALPEHKMPDAIVTISTVRIRIWSRSSSKSTTTPFVEDPVPCRARAPGTGGSRNGQILGYTYNLNPLFRRGTSICTVAVSDTPSGYTARVDPAFAGEALEVLYTPSLASHLRQELDEKRITVPFRLSVLGGSHAVPPPERLAPHAGDLNKLQSAIALATSFTGMLYRHRPLAAGRAPVPPNIDGAPRLPRRGRGVRA